MARSMLQRGVASRTCPAALTGPCRVAQRLVFRAARRCETTLCHASSSDNIEEPAAALSQQQASSPEPATREGLIKVPFNELPPADHQKAFKALHKNQQKTGLPRLVGETLAGTSITIIGDDTLLNNAFAKALATELGWFPTTCQAILSGMKKGSLKGEELIEVEQGILKGLRTQRRVAVATVRGGATSASDTYRDLWGSLIVRVDEEDKYSPKPKTPERALQAAAAEVEMIIRPVKGFGKAPLKTPTEKAQAHVGALLKQIAQLLQEQPELIQKKQQYMELGFRGDWPVLQPASWNPLVDSLERKPLVAP